MRADGRQALQALLVSEQDLRRAILERVVHLVRLPERIHGDGDGADGRRSHEGDHPLRIVAHGDRHPISLADAVVLDQRSRQGAGAPPRFLKGQALVLVDDERQVAAA